jgi:hypothetical protein
MEKVERGRFYQPVIAIAIDCQAWLGAPVGSTEVAPVCRNRSAQHNGLGEKYRGVEAKEIIVSFGIVQGDDYDAALAIARACPPGDTIEIRELAGYA